MDAYLLFPVLRDGFCLDLYRFPLLYCQRLFTGNLNGFMVSGFSSGCRSMHCFGYGPGFSAAVGNDDDLIIGSLLQACVSVGRAADRLQLQVFVSFAAFVSVYSI